MHTPHRTAPWPLALLVAAALAACATPQPVPTSTPPSAPAFVCPDGASIELDLDAWAESLRGADPTELEPLLERLQLLPPGTTDDDLRAEGEEAAPFSLDAVELLRPHLLGAAAEPAVVAIAYFSDGTSASSVRARVLTPSHGHQLCLVPNGDLSYDVPQWQQPTLGDDAYGGAGRHITVERGPQGREVLWIVDGTGSCCGSERGARYALNLLGLSASGLKSLFETVLYEAWYTSPVPPRSEEVTTVDLKGDTLTLVSSTVCGDEEDADPDRPLEPCTSTEESSHWTFDGHRFVQDATGQP